MLSDTATARIIVFQMMTDPFRPISREYAKRLLAEIDEKERREGSER